MGIAQKPSGSLDPKGTWMEHTTNGPVCQGPVLFTHTAAGLKAQCSYYLVQGPGITAVPRKAASLPMNKPFPPIKTADKVL